MPLEECGEDFWAELDDAVAAAQASKAPNSAPHPNPAHPQPGPGTPVLGRTSAGGLQCITALDQLRSLEPDWQNPSAAAAEALPGQLLQQPPREGMRQQPPPPFAETHPQPPAHAGSVTGQQSLDSYFRQARDGDSSAASMQYNSGPQQPVPSWRQASASMGPCPGISVVQRDAYSSKAGAVSSLDQNLIHGYGQQANQKAQVSLYDMLADDEGQQEGAQEPRHPLDLQNPTRACADSALRPSVSSAPSYAASGTRPQAAQPPATAFNDQSYEHHRPQWQLPLQASPVVCTSSATAASEGQPGWIGDRRSLTNGSRGFEVASMKVNDAESQCVTIIDADFEEGGGNWGVAETPHPVHHPFTSAEAAAPSCYNVSQAAKPPADHLFYYESQDVSEERDLRGAERSRALAPANLSRGARNFSASVKTMHPGDSFDAVGYCHPAAQGGSQVHEEEEELVFDCTEDSRHPGHTPAASQHVNELPQIAPEAQQPHASAADVLDATHDHSGPGVESARTDAQPNDDIQFSDLFCPNTQDVPDSCPQGTVVVSPCTAVLHQQQATTAGAFPSRSGAAADASEDPLDALDGGCQILFDDASDPEYSVAGEQSFGFGNTRTHAGLQNIRRDALPAQSHDNFNSSALGAASSVLGTTAANSRLPGAVSSRKLLRQELCNAVIAEALRESAESTGSDLRAVIARLAVAINQAAAATATGVSAEGAKKQGIKFSDIQRAALADCGADEANGDVEAAVGMPARLRMAADEHVDDQGPLQSVARRQVSDHVPSFKRARGSISMPSTLKSAAPSDAQPVPLNAHLAERPTPVGNQQPSAQRVFVALLNLAHQNNMALMTERSNPEGLDIHTGGASESYATARPWLSLKAPVVLMRQISGRTDSSECDLEDCVQIYV